MKRIQGFWIFLFLVLFVTGCSQSKITVEDPSMTISKEDLTFLDSTLDFQCGAVNDYFYNLYFGIMVRNESNRKITNSDIEKLGLEAGLLNINGLGREETNEFLLTQEGIEPGETGQLAFTLAPSTGFEWKSVDISINSVKVFERSVKISASVCN